MLSNKKVIPLSTVPAVNPAVTERGLLCKWGHLLPEVSRHLTLHSREWRHTTPKLESWISGSTITCQSVLASYCSIHSVLLCSVYRKLLARDQGCTDKSKRPTLLMSETCGIFRGLESSWSQVSALLPPYQAQYGSDAASSERLSESQFKDTSLDSYPYLSPAFRKLAVIFNSFACFCVPFCWTFLPHRHPCWINNDNPSLIPTLLVFLVA